MKNSTSNDELSVEKLEKAFESDILKKRLTELEKENAILKKYLEANGLLEEIKNLSISDEEFICVNELKKLKVLSDKGMLTLDDIKGLDILHKNLRAIRGLTIDNFKSKGKKKADPKELLKIVENR
jgi:hypothetical protein